MMKKELSKTQQQREEKIQAVYAMIKDAYDQRRYPPSIREICQELGINSTSTIHAYLTELENRGLIIVHRGVNRGLILAKKAV